MQIPNIARVCHEANRALCEAHGDHSQVRWADAPDWQKKSAEAGVRFHIGHPEATPGASHEAWVLHKLDEGWQYGPVKDEFQQTHPAIMPFSELPLEVQAKDHIFRAIVHALAG